MPFPDRPRRPSGPEPSTTQPAGAGEPPTAPVPGATERRLHRRALLLLGVSRRQRDEVVREAFQRGRRDAVGYWLQMLLSVAIATLGLALDSTAVVIGAMLISPLMAPIVELGMGLAVGSPVLTLRSFVRVLGSVAASVAGAALLTRLLPFQEMTREITSRTAPTALDLSIAIFIAFAAVFTTVRSTSETTSAAAGTAIGIALVPPLCVIGYGLGIGQLAVARGASLLFVTNLTAILVIAAVCFLLLGFERVDTRTWEGGALARLRPGSFTRRAVESLRAAFGSRYSRVLRILLPLLLLAAVTAPLTHALEQVAWEVQARSSVGRIVEEVPKPGDVVQSQVSVKQHAVAVRLYLVGSPEQAGKLEAELARRIAAATQVVPTVRVVAVPDMSALQQLNVARVLEVEADGGAAITELRRRLGGTLAELWPAPLGPLVGWALELQDTASVQVVVRHLGAPATPAADELLGRVLAERLGYPVTARTLAYPAEPLRVDAEAVAPWLVSLTRLVTLLREAPRLHACVRVPETGADSVTLAAVRRELRLLPPAQVQLQAAGEVWELRLTPQPCEPPPPAREP